jgi:hypothetical protein
MEEARVNRSPGNSSIARHAEKAHDPDAPA